MNQDEELMDKFGDKRFKGKTLKKTESYLQSLGCKIELDVELDSEITGIQKGQSIADKIYLCKNKEIAIVESENSDPNDYATNKILRYDIRLREKYPEIKEMFKDKGEFPKNPTIRKIIINENPIKPIQDIKIPVKPDDCFITIEMYSPHEINGDEMLENIKYKIKHNTPLTKYEYEFFNYPLKTKFNKIQPHEMIIEVVKIIEEYGIHKEGKEELYIEYIEDCKRTVNKKYLNQTLERIYMIGDAVIKHDNEIRKETRKETWKQATKDIIQTLKEYGTPDEIISAVSEKYNL